MDKKEIIEQIINGIIDFKIIPFFGSGMSKSCGSLDWKEIIDELKKDLTTIETDYLLVAQEYENKFGRDLLITRLQEFCELKSKDSNSLQNHLRILAMNPPFIYTTNYDNALEDAAQLLLRNYKKIVGLKDIVQSSHGAKQIIKFHGDFSDKASIIFTRKDYNQRLELEKHPLDVLFRSHILGKSVLFLGYSFADENIQLIFDMHKELYGNENTPTSYIISFEKDEIKENELKARNVITLVLSSADELSDLISEISNSVFDQSSEAEFNAMFKASPSIVLANFELENLKNYISNQNYSEKEKHDKIRETIEGKAIPQDVEDDLTQYLESVINGDYSDEVKEAVLFSFPHIQFRWIKNIVKLSMELMRLTENPKFNLDFEIGHFGTDAITFIEHKLGETFKNSAESRKWICRIILGYLEGMWAEKKKLPYKQTERLLDALRNYRYKELGDLSATQTLENSERVIEYYLNQHGASLKSHFQRTSYLGTDRTATEIMEEMLKLMPKYLQI